MLRRIKNLLHRVLLHEEALGLENEILVWDTSSISHALEEFSHSVMSAYLQLSPPKNWSKLKTAILRRFKSEYLSRNLLIKCDTNTCFIPNSIAQELARDPYYKDSMNILLGRGYLVEEKYVRRKSQRGSPIGFSQVFKPRLHVRDPDPVLVNRILTYASRLGIKVSEQDVTALALAYELGGILVTADRRLVELANLLNVRVIYTIPKVSVEQKREVVTI